jgi:hypothetical protein
MPFDAALPLDHAGLLKKGLELIETCRSSSGKRAAYYRQLAMVADTGRQDGSRALINMLYRHLDRVASHLFSPTELRFNVDFDEDYDEETMNRGKRAARLLTRKWMRSNTDIVFGMGVFEALKYGAAVLKQWPSRQGNHGVKHNRALVMPWQFGLYREDKTDLNEQPAMCETFMLSMPEVWARIWHLPDARKLYTRIEQHARQTSADDEMNSFFHQVLSTSQLNTGVQAASRPLPGGIVQVTNMPNQATLSAHVIAPLVKMHELWVQDEGDYTTIQIIEPDILVAPLLRKANLLIGSPMIPDIEGPHQPEADKSQLHPYTMICANLVHGYAWGRSELTDLIEPQDNLAGMSDDMRRLIGLVVDRIIGFPGDDGISDESYDQMRRAGYMKSAPGASIVDLTPSFPAELPGAIQGQISIIEMLGGLDGMMSGKGEPGVRAGNMQRTLLKTASPGLRDRSLVVERQCAAAADLWLSVMEAKDPATYWTDGRTAESREKTSFTLADLPDDRAVSVDSHSSSPIFADDHVQLTAFGLKDGVIGPEDALEDLPFPNKELKRVRLLARQEQQKRMTQELLQKDPQALEKLLTKGHGHR